MSKQSKKDKKLNQAFGIQQQYENQRRQLLDYQFTIKKMQQRIDDLTQQNLKFKKTIDDSAQVFNEKLEEFTIKNMANEKRLLSLSKEKTKLEIQNEQKQNKIKMLQKNLFEQQQAHLKDVEQSKKNYYFEVAKYESQLSQYKLYMNERDQMDQQRQELREKIQILKANKLREVADKEREKVQATDKIKDQMNQKIKDMEKNLVSLKRDQLQTTTRLTILQNHQLTSELQYQSKQTEKLIFKNQQLEQKVNSLKQELIIHKQVEDQLAKRSHFSKGVIQKLNLKVNELENELDQLKNQLGIAQNRRFDSQSSNKQPESPPKKIQANRSDLEQSYQGSAQIVQSLQKELKKSQKKYTQLLGDCQHLKKQKQAISTKLGLFEKRTNQLFKIMYRYYNEVLLKTKQGKISVDQQDEEVLKQNSVPYQFNLQHLREVPPQSWKIEDITLTIQILLNIIQPYMTRSNLMIPAVRKNILLFDGLTHIKSDSSFKSLPRLSTERKEAYKLHDNKYESIPSNIISRIARGNQRDWGQTVKMGKTCFKRKYKVVQNFIN